MGLLDGLMKSGNLGALADVVAKNPQLLSAAAALLSTKHAAVGGTGGLAGLVGAFQQGGLGDVMSSWIGGGPNKPVEASALAGILGNDTLGQFAKMAGIDASQAGSMLAGVLPALVNQITPQGQMPETNAIEDVLGSLLGGR